MSVSDGGSKCVMGGEKEKESKKMRGLFDPFIFGESLKKNGGKNDFVRLSREQGGALF